LSLPVISYSVDCHDGLAPRASIARNFSPAA
jgi:hypothetical protein